MLNGEKRYLFVLFGLQQHFLSSGLAIARLNEVLLSYTLHVAYSTNQIKCDSFQKKLSFIAATRCVIFFMIYNLVNQYNINYVFLYYRMNE